MKPGGSAYVLESVVREASREHARKVLDIQGAYTPRSKANFGCDLGGR
jgi:hypothetical protein